MEKFERIKKRTIYFLILILLLLLLIFIILFLIYHFGRIGYVANDKVIGYIDEMKIIEIYDNNLLMINNEELDIFKNKIFDGKNMIAPHSSGAYKFAVKNLTAGDIEYSINFEDEMDNFVNMKYRLRIDNVYIRGSETEYIELSKLGVENIKVLKDSINVFTIEWYWEDKDKEDTYIGSLKDTQKYRLNFEVIAHRIGENEEELI